MLFFSLDLYLERYKSKQHALFHAIRDAILAGKLESHDKLPATRILASQYQLSRGTVSNVYDMLVAQGYIYSIKGSGTFVSEYSLPAKDATSLPHTNRLSEWGLRLTKQMQLTTLAPLPTTVAKEIKDKPISFQLNKVNLTDFPLKEWNKFMFEQTRLQYENETLNAYTTDGHPKLKQSIAKHLHIHRGIKTDDEQIVIVNGSQQALTLLVHLLVNKGDCIALEDPHYLGIRHAIEVVGGQLHSFPVDLDGIVFDPVSHNQYKFVYITPNRHFPTGSILSMERRQRLLKWANQQSTYIIEDDYDSEFNYTTRALEPLKALDTHDNVIYIGTFSRTMMQNIRIGYAILPKHLVVSFKLAKTLFERHPASIIQQRALAEFIDSGFYDRHLRRVKRLYRQRSDYLQQLLQKKLSHIFMSLPIKAGLHLYAQWVGPPQLFHAFLECCKQLEVHIVNSEGMFYKNPQKSVCLGFAHLSLEEIDEGIRRLELAWENVRY